MRGPNESVGGAGGHRTSARDSNGRRGNATTTALADATTITNVTGRFVESDTNLATGKTIIRNVSGPTTTTQRPDGTATFVGAGNNRLIFGPRGRANSGEPALVITSGRVVVTFTGNVATSFSLAGRQENLCATLAAL